MGKKRYCYYQPNGKDLKDEYGDCQIRALSKVWGLSWLEAYDRTIPVCREEQVIGVFDAPAYIRKRFMEKLGFTYTGVSNKRGTKRPTVDGFAKDHPTGRYILNVANHEVACVDGKYYDTWDCGDCSLYGWFSLDADR